MANNTLKYGEEMSICKSLIISHIGGGKSQIALLLSGIVAGYCPTMGSRRLSLCLYSRLSLCLVVCALALSLVGCRPKATVCGVPYL